MENHSEFQLLKLKVASELVRSSQAVVAFSRAFYLEEVLIEKISSEVHIAFEEYLQLQGKLDSFLQQANVEDNIVVETNLRLLCSTIRSGLEGQFNGNPTDVFQDFEARIVTAEARRQAKSSLLQALSGNNVMARFDFMTFEELREVQVPEFSCFINESDFTQLEKLNEEWSHFRKGFMTLLKSSLSQMEKFRQNDATQFYRKIKIPQHPTKQNEPESGTSTFSGTLTRDVPLDEIGKTFANRSGNVLRKFSSLLRRGKRKSFTCDVAFDECSESKN